MSVDFNPQALRQMKRTMVGVRILFKTRRVLYRDVRFRILRQLAVPEKVCPTIRAIQATPKPSIILTPRPASPGVVHINRRRGSRLDHDGPGRARPAPAVVPGLGAVAVARAAAAVSVHVPIVVAPMVMVVMMVVVVVVLRVHQVRRSGPGPRPAAAAAADVLLGRGAQPVTGAGADDPSFGYYVCVCVCVCVSERGGFVFMEPSKRVDWRGY